VVAKIKRQVNIWVDQEVYDALREVSEKRRVSMAWIAREALLRYLPKKKGTVECPKSSGSS
jgi:predicted transcriptional regulator